MVDLIRRSCVRFPPRSKESFLYSRVVPVSTLLGLTPGGSFMSFTYSTLIYTSVFNLCSTICVHSATRLNIHIIICSLTFSSPRFTTLSSPTFSIRPRSSVGKVTLDLIRRSRVRFPPRSKEFFLYLMWFLDSLY